MITCSIDPGLSGAVCLLRDGIPFEVHDLPLLDGEIDGWTLRLYVDAHDPVATSIERVGAMPDQHAASMFKFAANWGIIRGALCHRKPTLVTPRQWKSHHSLYGIRKDLGYRERKDLSRLLALELWPQMAGVLARKKDVDRAESMLIGRYSWWIKTEGIS